VERHYYPAPVCAPCTERFLSGCQLRMQDRRSVLV
jgi:hypothetical protein